MELKWSVKLNTRKIATGAALKYYNLNTFKNDCKPEILAALLFFSMFKKVYSYFRFISPSYKILSLNLNIFTAFFAKKLPPFLPFLALSFTSLFCFT